MKLFRYVVVGLILSAGFLVFVELSPVPTDFRVALADDGDDDSDGGGFPAGGVDVMETDGIFYADVFGQRLSLNVSGPTVVERQDPLPTSREIPTEIISMTLTGSSDVGPVIITAGRTFGLPRQ